MRTDLQTVAAVSAECVVSGIQAQNPPKKTVSAPWILAMAATDRYIHTQTHTYTHRHVHLHRHTAQIAAGWIPEKTESTRWTLATALAVALLTQPILQDM